MQTFYPIFESGQVLTNAHLNQMSAWLNEQIQASRTKLIGIGIVCGLDAVKAGDQVTVSGGVAVTSAGYLLTQENNLTYTQFRNYEIPVSAAVEDDNTVDSIEVPPLLPDTNIQLWELLTDDVEQTAESSPLTGLNEAFLSDKVVMLLLEAKVQSLKNCDVNNCADKGARYQFTLRTLLIHEDDARELWQAETADSSELLPLDNNWQLLREQLKPASMEKLIVSAGGLQSLELLHSKVQSIAATAWQGLRAHLQASFDVYGWVLRARFPAEQFPVDPWEGMSVLFDTQARTAQDLLLNIHHYDVLQDMVCSYNEFLEAAYEFNAICCPNAQRFPFHVFLGYAETADVAAQPANQGIDFGIGAIPGDKPLRHPFYRSPQLQEGKALAQKMCDLYYRTWLLAKRYRTNQLLALALKISPSKLHSDISRKAIPFYFDLSRGDDLHRNWNPDFTRNGKLSVVEGYRVSADSPHPLARIPQDHDFYRVEGLGGKPLGQSIAELRLQKQQLGLSFAIEPVFAPVQLGDKQFSQAALLSLLLKDRTLFRLFKCKLSDMDIIFLLLMAVIFQLLLTLVYLLSRLRPAESQAVAAPQLMRLSLNESALRAALENEDTLALQFAADELAQSNNVGHFYLNQVKRGDIKAVDLIDALDETDDPNGINAQVYQAAKKESSGDLLERVRKVVGDNADEQQLQETYQSARMLQQSEKLMAHSSVESIAQFDFDEFNVQLEELNSAHREFNQSVNTQNNAQVETVLTGVNQQMGLLSTLSKSALLTNMQEEFSQRIKSIFEEFMLDGFARKHPGMEHLCGVPKGGTLVLVYTHKTLLDNYTPPIQEEAVTPAAIAATSEENVSLSETTNSNFLMRNAAFLTPESEVRAADDHLRSLVDANRNNRSAMIEIAERANVSNVNSVSDAVAAPAASAANPQFALAANAFELLDVSRAVDEGDPLNDMIVVADFCLPTFCCDSDCSDLELAAEPEIPQEKPQASKVSVSGKIVAATQTRVLTKLVRQKQTPILDASMAVIDRDNQTVKVKMSRGAFLFKVVPGTYTVRASAPGYATEEEQVEIGRSVLKDIVVQLEPSKSTETLRR